MVETSVSLEETGDDAEDSVGQGQLYYHFHDPCCDSMFMAYVFPLLRRGTQPGAACRASVGHSLSRTSKLPDSVSPRLTLTLWVPVYI